MNIISFKLPLKEPLTFLQIAIWLFPFANPAWCQSIPEEKNGYVEVEAEAFESQELDAIRKWYPISADSPAAQLTDTGKYQHASGGSYIQVLPDTRKTHDDKLIHGENFSNEPGKIAVLHYQVKFNNAGKYYVWARAFSTGSEDNGLHTGINGEWVESGQRMQWCEGKNQWTWASKQRTTEEHCGVEKLIYLQVDQPGIHTISFSMREDGFAFDKWVMSTAYQIPN